MVTATLLTAIELEVLDFLGNCHELVKGGLVEVTPEGGDHGAIGMRTAVQIGKAVEQRMLGELFTSDTGFVVARDPDSVLMPDVAFVSAHRLPESQLWEGFVPFSPDLAVEIESPSNREGEMLGKVALCLEGGSRLVWLVRPKHRTVTVFRPGEPELVFGEDDLLDGFDILPGFTLPVTDLFRSLAQRG